MTPSPDAVAPGADATPAAADVAPHATAPAPDGEVAAAEPRQQQGFFGGANGVIILMALWSFGVNYTSRQTPTVKEEGGARPAGAPPAGVSSFSNLYGTSEQCDLLVYLSSEQFAPSHVALADAAHSEELGLRLLWNEEVWYDAKAAEVFRNVTVGPFSTDVLFGNASSPYLIAVLVSKNGRRTDGRVPIEHVVNQSFALFEPMYPMDADAGTGNLLGDSEGEASPKFDRSEKLPHLKTKIDIRPVFDHTVHSKAALKKPPFNKLRAMPIRGQYQPYLYISDFWLLEKDYIVVNTTLKGQMLNLSLSYSMITMWSWNLQMQMSEQKKETAKVSTFASSSQRDSFMMKRLFLDTNPYLLAFSGTFIMLHLIIGLLAFKNDIQFWRKNESMQGLSARTMVVSWVCQLVTCLYLLDSQETSWVIMIEIVMDLTLATWKLRKAVKFRLQLTYPFVAMEGQTGYEQNDTAKYDEEAIRYMSIFLAPCFAAYTVYSLLYNKHRGWWSFIIGTLAGGVYTFGFIMMTPQLYINYKLQSVEHLPWRALTYKAMNTFVDDIFALLIDMPMLHRLSCFRDDIIFFIYLFQRWHYRVDKSRPTMWARPEELAAVTDSTAAPLTDVTTTTPDVAEVTNEGLRQRVSPASAENSHDAH